MKKQSKNILTKELYTYLEYFSKGIELLYEFYPPKNDLYQFCVNIAPYSKNEIALYEPIFATMKELKDNELKKLEYLKRFYNSVIFTMGNSNIIKYDELHLKCSSYFEPHYDIPLELLDNKMLISKIEYFIKKMVNGLIFNRFQVLSSNCDFFKSIEFDSFDCYLKQYSKNLQIKENMMRLEKGIPIYQDEKTKLEENVEIDTFDKMILKGLHKFNPKNNDYLYSCLNRLNDEFFLSDAKKCYQNTFCAITLLIYNSGVITKGVTYSSFLRAMCTYFNRPIPKETKPNKYAEKARELKEKHYILDNLPLK